jgi:hypothetical protein
MDFTGLTKNEAHWPGHPLARPFAILVGDGAWTAAGDGGAMVALAGNAGGFVPLAGENRMLSCCYVAPPPQPGETIATTLGELRAWTGPAQHAVRETCPWCKGTTRVKHECDASCCDLKEVDCAQCDDGKVEVPAAVRLGRVCGVVINRNLLALYTVRLGRDEQEVQVMACRGPVGTFVFVDGGRFRVVIMQRRFDESEAIAEWGAAEPAADPLCSICRDRHPSDDRHPCE